MKKMNIKIFSRLSYVAKAALLVSLFAGCSLVTSEKDIKKNENLSENSSRLFKVSGKCSFEGTSSSRSAISSFSLADFSEDEISVKAYHLIRTPVTNSDNLEIYTFAREPGYSESETSSNILQPCLGSLDVYFNEWSLELNQPGWWEIEISLTRDGKTLLYGSTISSPLEIVATGRFVQRACRSHLKRSATRFPRQSTPSAFSAHRQNTRRFCKVVFHPPRRESYSHDRQSASGPPALFPRS